MERGPVLAKQMLSQLSYTPSLATRKHFRAHRTPASIRRIPLRNSAADRPTFAPQTQFRAAAVSPQATWQFEQHLQLHLREMGRQVVQHTYNALEPDDVHALPQHVRCEGTCYTRLGRKTPQLIEVRKGNNADMRIAVVRRMIAIIRDFEKEDFNWESPRRGHVVLSARLSDNAGLEDYLMHEFFDDGGVPH